MNLTSPIDTLSKKGYLVYPAVINLEIVHQMHEHLKNRLNRLQNQFQEWSGGQDATSIENYRYHSDKINEYETKGLPKDLRHFLRGEFDLETRLSPEIREFMSVPSLRDALTNVLGEPQYFLHYPPMVRFKFPNAGQTIVPPHQDSAYSEHIEQFIAAWVPLTPITAEVGGVVFYEGTQDIGKLTHGASGAWESRALFDETAYPTSAPLMELGDVLFFTPTIVHASGPNTSENTIRFSIDMRAFSTNIASPKAYFDPWSGQIYNN
jgi:hypothetical protein